MPNPQITAEVRLYRWLNRKTTPPDVWKTLSLKQLAEKARCSRSMVSRKLPKVVAKLKAVPLDEAEKLVDDVMNVRRCRLLDWEVEILEHLRKKDPPVSMFRLSLIFGVSEKNISDHLQFVGARHATRYRCFLLGQFGTHLFLKNSAIGYRRSNKMLRFAEN